MSGPSSYQELFEKHSQVLLLLDAAHLEIKRQGQIIEAFQKRFFGSSSERLDPLQDQLAFGDDVLGKPEPPAAKTSGPGEDASSEKPERKRRTKAETRPRNIPVIIDQVLVAKEVTDNPEAFRKIGESYTDILEARRAHLFYKRTIVEKYVSIDDRSAPPIKAPAPTPPVPGTMFGPYLASLIVCEKFCDSLPYYRQSQRIARLLDYEVSRSTLNTTAFSVADLLAPVVGAIRDELLGSDVLQIDETPIDYLSPGKGSTAQGYLWVYRAPATKTVYYDWQTGRGLECLLNVLDYDPETETIAYHGKIQCDGYQVYQALAKQFKKIKLAGCLAHLRRKFYDARIEHPETSLPILLCIQRIYQIEKQIKQGGGPPGCRKLIRLARIGPELRELYAKISEATHPLVLPKSKLGEALTYARNQREKIEAILSDGNFELDTNLVENAIRITKVGAKNYLFFGNAEAGKKNAILYTLLENCKTHGLKPEQYLSETIEAINRLGPDAKAEEIAALTPSRIAASRKVEAEVKSKAA
jgi:transposase